MPAHVPRAAEHADPQAAVALLAVASTKGDELRMHPIRHVPGQLVGVPLCAAEYSVLAVEQCRYDVRDAKRFGGHAGDHAELLGRAPRSVLRASSSRGRT